MSQVCESPPEEEFNFNLLPNEIDQSEEQQKQLKIILSEFRKNRENNIPKKLYNSSNIKKVPNLLANSRNHQPQNINRNMNEDGTTTETKVEKMQDGREKITKTRYDRNHHIISRKVYYNDIDNNYNNYNNINHNYNMINNNNINYNNNPNRGHIFRASNGLTIETKIERLPNGKTMEIKTIRDENNNIIDVQEDELIPNNQNYMPNNIARPPPMNSMPPNMNNYIRNNPFIPSMGMNPPLNNFRMNMLMNPMNPMNINMNNNMRNIPNPMHPMYPMPMMNNFGFPFMNMMMPIPMPNIDVNRIDPRILNSLPENEIEDASKLDSDNKNCVICLEDFKDKDHIICLPCIHVFHSECIKSWLNKNNSCPTCKFELTFENLNSH